MKIKVLLVTVSLLLLYPMQAFALTQAQLNALQYDAEYYLGNPTTTSSACAGNPATGTGVVVAIYNYLLSKGLNATAISGVLGNLWAESGVETERLQGPGNQLVPAQNLTQAQLSDNNLGWGLAQWTNPGKMVTPLLNAGQNPNNLDTQLDFLYSNPYGVNDIVNFKTKLQSAPAPSQAARVFYVNFEQPYYKNHPIPPSVQANLIQRETAAQNFYNFLVLGIPLPPGMGLSGNNTVTNPGSTNCSSTGNISDCQNPLRSVVGLVPLRIDQGVDYQGTGPVYAVCPGKVVDVSTTNSGWPGNGTACNPAPCNGTFIKYELTAGPATGDYVYFAEDCTPAVQVGQILNTQTVICNMYEGGTNIETGWTTSAAGTATLCSAQYQANGGNNYATSCGQNFSAMLKELGAPPGVIRGNAATTPLTGYPTWGG